MLALVWWCSGCMYIACLSRCIGVEVKDLSQWHGDDSPPVGHDCTDDFMHWFLAHLSSVCNGIGWWAVVSDVWRGSSLADSAWSDGASSGALAKMQPEVLLTREPEPEPEPKPEPEPEPELEVLSP
jgi:hypothetical protein